MKSLVNNNPDFAGLKKFIQKYFTGKKGVLSVYIFGSVARKASSSQSDVDIAVLFGESEKDTLQLISKYESDLSKILSRKVEIVDLGDCRIDFIYRVLEEGIVLYCPDELKRAGYEQTVMRKYLDLKPFFREYYEVLQKQALGGNFHV